MSVVFDSSAIIALIKEEPGHEIVRPYVHEGFSLTVNFAEAVAYFARTISSKAVLWEILAPFMDGIVPLNKETSFLTGYLSRETKRQGLSLGDRACLALGISKKMPVLTADKKWAELDLPVDVRLIR
ncbi:protein domain protein [Leptolyngbya sp. Heron Island J]|uniref:type II toxin-antitoxin system VapC family toxin n=1 Tax=Leptolyngbya sp. Heron Island J TaxID=1385935 RepID=UPI0003B94424|nr:type II toxin-antitoxin system VapC family toxin [Leptolyngbya sp. Heron Island J]ESA37135.1 protein domain protein [Leptolyngbya sp. Heron Island J]